MSPAVKGVWATEGARGAFPPSEMDWCVACYQERGAQQFVDGIAFAVYECSGGRELLLCERRGLVSLMTLEEVEADAREAGLGPSVFTKAEELAEEGGANFG